MGLIQLKSIPPGEYYDWATLNHTVLLTILLSVSPHVGETSVNLRWKWDHELNELRNKSREVKGVDALADTHNHILLWL